MVINKNTTNQDKQWGDHEWIQGRIDRDITMIQITLSDFEAMKKHPRHIVELRRKSMDIQGMGRDLIHLSKLLQDVGRDKRQKKDN